MRGKSLKNNGLNEKITNFAYIKIMAMYTDYLKAASAYNGTGVNTTSNLYIITLSLPGPPVYLSS